MKGTAGSEVLARKKEPPVNYICKLLRANMVTTLRYPLVAFSTSFVISFIALRNCRAPNLLLGRQKHHLYDLTSLQLTVTSEGSACCLSTSIQGDMRGQWDVLSRVLETMDSVSHRRQELEVDDRAVQLRRLFKALTRMSSSCP